jgi:3-dehydroquinate synthase
VAKLSVKVVTQAAPGASYEVHIGRGLLGRSVGPLAKGRRVLLVVDSNVPATSIGGLVGAVERTGKQYAVLPVLTSEKSKTLGTVARVLEAAATLSLGRDDLMIAVGGGVLTDLVGLAAGLHRRGCEVVHCPSTLLAMVDGSVGGKTAANIEVDGRLIKNGVGVFHQPARVVCDMDLLGSLPERTFRAGLAECLKHGLLGGAFADATLWDDTVQSVERGPAAESAGLAALVARNVKLKAAVVALDERETRDDLPGGGRMALNLGHTFAHAIETLDGLSWFDGRRVRRGTLLHGEAVGLGLICAATLSAELGSCDRGFADRVRLAVGLAGLPVEVGGLPPDSELLARMGSDKKVKGGKGWFVVISDDLRPAVRSDVAPSLVRAALAAIRTSPGRKRG